MQLNEALSIFEDHLDDVKSALASNLLHNLSKLKRPEPVEDEMLNWVRQEVFECRKQELRRTPELVIRRIVSRQQHKNKPRGGITDDMLTRARDYPIVELFTELTNQPVRHNMVKCPFHDDKTASMSLGKYNRYTCFGCGEKGDTIDLYMKINKCSFIQAVKELV